MRRSPAVRSLLTVIFVLHPFSVRAEDVTVQEHLKRFLRDGVYVAASPLRLEWQDLLPIVAVGGAVVTTIAYDDEIRDRLVKLRRWGGVNGLTTAGDVLQFGGLIGGAGLYAYGRLVDDDRAVDHAWLQADGVLWSTAFGIGLKYTIGRARPDSGHAHSFKPFSGDTSLPSGHTLPAFTAAMLAAEEYESLAVRLPVFALATAVGISRIAADKHWAGDVLASAALGIGIGHVLYRVHSRPLGNWEMRTGDGTIQIVRRF